MITNPAEQQTSTHAREERDVSEIAEIVHASGYSELSDTEIDKYLEWRCEIAARDAQAAASQQRQQAEATARIKQSEEFYAQAKARLDELTNGVLNG